ncbi:hypothetical protein IEO70_11060 [Bacillus sp. AGMB 02131]|uniref:Lipoprotein n=1 Tax=Peribacillus faecalis TaxID=2772559 RepID=A0A927CZY9_9BACI|nr:hypothetical protein [Peribacillus faecalis]MBD3108900.1 hypothetical protein [Peribacillus faecalis]
MKNILIVIASLSVFLMGCGKTSEIKLDKMSDYNLLDYLPSKNGTFREYITYGTEKKAVLYLGII